MKKKIKVLVTVEVDHGKRMHPDKIKQLALDSVHCSQIIGCSTDHGSYCSKQISKEVQK